MPLPNLLSIYPIQKFDPKTCIIVSYKRPILSPISIFTQESRRLHIYSNPKKFDYHLSNYIFLGQMSIAESYLRAIIRNVINIDEKAYRNVASKAVTYAAAQYLDEWMMPEALLEKTSFASAQNIQSSLEELIAYKYKTPAELAVAFEEFEKICQLRHCISHRFSYFGSNNAIRLGIKEYNNFIEKPIQFDYASLQSAFQVIDIFIRMLNNHLFSYLLERVSDEGGWSWDYRSDSKKFESYYYLFLDIHDKRALGKYYIYQELRKLKK